MSPVTMTTKEDEEEEEGGGEGGPGEEGVQGAWPVSMEGLGEEIEDREEQGTEKCRVKGRGPVRVEMGAISGEATRGRGIFRGARSGGGK